MSMKDFFFSTEPKWAGKRRIWTIPMTLVLFFILGTLFHGLKTGDYFFWEVKPDSSTTINTASFRVVRSPEPRISQDQVIEPLLLRFQQSAAPLEEIGKAINQGIEIEPQVPGTWVWKDGQNLEFTPEQDWVPGTRYDIKIQKSQLAEHMAGQNLRGSFRVEAFNARFTQGEFYIDPSDPGVKRVIIQLDFNYPVDLESLRSLLDLKVPTNSGEPNFDGMDLDFEITMDEDNRKAYLVSQPLPMPQENISLEYVLEKGLQCTLGGEPSRRSISESITVPGLNQFIKIQNIEMTLVRREDYSVEQLVVINTKGEWQGRDLTDYLDLWVLPKDRPAQEGVEARDDYRWSNAGEINSVILDHSTPLSYQVQQTERDYSSIQSLRIQANPGQYLYVKVKQGAPFYGGYNLARDYETIVRVKDFPRTLELMGDGAILSMGGSKELTMITQGMDRVTATLYRVLPDQINHLVTQTRGDISEMSFYSSRFNESNISEVFSEDLRFPGARPDQVQFHAIDLNQYIHRSGSYRNGFFFLKLREYNGGASLNRFVMITDLGILCKRNNDNSSDLFVQGISTGNPVSAARVQVLGRNGLPVFSGTTDGQGHVSIPRLNTSRAERQPVAIVVTKNQDVSFLPYESSDRRISFSNFDTGGVWDAGQEDNLRAYLFSDRGIYRPGDPFRIGMLVRSGEWSRRLNGTPLRVFITNPRGVQIYQKDLFLDSMGFEELEYQTEEHFPTGDYRISLYLVERNDRLVSLGSTNIELKEFLPDRLKIDSQILGTHRAGWVSLEDLKYRVSLKNLFGTAAVGNNVEAYMELAPAWFRFSQYRGFRFTDPFRSNESYRQELGESVTDNLGEVEFPIDLSQFDQGSYRLSANALGFEKDSGRNVSTQTSLLVSPNEYLVGWKAEGDLDYIYKDADLKLEFIAIDPDLEKRELSDLELIRLQTDYVSVLTRQPNGVYKYESVKKEQELERIPFSIPADGIIRPIDSTEPGEYSLILKNDREQVLATIHYTVVGQGNLTRSLDANTQLQIQLNKSSYSPGESIEVFIKAPFEGSGLITIEQDRVYAYKWFQSNGNSSLQRITLPSGIEGNAYINVSYIRSADSQRIYVNPLSYGAAPFDISREARINEISLELPEVVKPGDILQIKYETENPGKILIYGVDQGILQVADYQTPDPLNHFLQKRALEVESYQILDLILPEFDRLSRQSPYGGGAGFERLLEANLNPFSRKRDKPVVFWSGILDNPRGEGAYTYQVPDYFNGSLKVFAMAVGAQDVGITTESTFIRDDLIISPTLPLFAAPGDEFILSVNVANNILVNEDSRPVLLELDVSDHLEILGEDSLTQTVEAGRDQNFQFRLRAKERLGSGDVLLRASTGHYESNRSVSLSVRPAMPYQVRLQTGIVRAGRENEMDLFTQQYEEFQKKEIHLSYMPLAVTGGLQDYLESYPYNCTEQATSRTFPYVSFFHTPDVEMDRDEARRKVTRTMDLLMSRLRTDGGFGYWHSQSYVDVSFSIYAYHLVIEAIEEGFAVPSILLERGEAFLWDIAKDDYGQGVNHYQQAYAIYLLTRLERVTTNELTRLKEDLQEESHWRRSSALPFVAASFELLQMHDEAQKILDQIEWGALFNTLGTYNYYLYNTQYLYLVARHFPGEIHRLRELIPELVETLENQQYNTINAAWTIMSLTELIKRQPEITSDEFVLKLINQAGEILPVIPQGTLLRQANLPLNHPELSLDNQNSLDLYYQISERGFDNILPDEKIAEGIEVFSEVQMNGSVTDTLKVGDQADWELSFRSLEQNSLERVAVVALLPAGCEISPDFKPEYNRDFLEYMDLREDRVVLYLNLTDRRKSFTIPIQAVSRGDFIYPPIFAQAMYDPTIKALSEGGRFHIVDP